MKREREVYRRLQRPTIRVLVRLIRDAGKMSVILGNPEGDGAFVRISYSTVGGP
jgi:hypothetical protein